MLHPRQTRLHRRGVTLIETIIGIGVFVLVAGGLYSSYLGLLRLTQVSRIRVAATAVATQYLEVVRNLPYASVGVQSGIPVGVLPTQQNATRDGFAFVVRYTVRNVDDPFDGTIGGTPHDTTPADYKQVTVEVTCPTCAVTVPTTRLTTTVAPKNLETSTNNGALFIQVLDANGQPVVGASVHIENSTLIPPVSLDDTTNTSGFLQLVDVPPALESYRILVTKSGYSTDRTYSPADPVVINPLKVDATVVVQQVTQVSFAIDRVSSLKISSLSSTCAAIPNVDFSLAGAKLIGTDPSVLKYSRNQITGPDGNLTLSNLEWDSYTALVQGSTYDLRGTIPLLPSNLAPNSSQDIKLIVQPRTPHSLLVVVRDGATSAPLSGAAVRLTKPGFDQTLLTSRGYIFQTNWQGGPGQQNFSDDTRYWSDDTNLSTNQPVGEIKLNKTGSTYASSGQLTSSTFDTGADATPPTISGITSSNLSANSATVAWLTDESSDSQVEYGPSTAYGNDSVLDPTLVTAHTVTLSGLQGSTTYHYRVKSRDSSGNLAVATDQVFTTTAGPPPPPPPVSDNFNGEPLDPAWVWTDPRGNSSYSLTANPGHLQVQLPAGTDHDCWTASSTCTRLLRNVTNPTEATWETKIDGLNLGQERHTYGILLWQDASSYVRFEYHYQYATKVWAYRVIGGSGSTAIDGPTLTLGNTNYLRVVRSGSTFTLSYSQNGSTWNTVGSFTQPGFTVNQVGVVVINAGGNPPTTANFDYFTITPTLVPDTTPPVVSGLTSSNFTADAASITWTTDELADSQVEYGLTSSYGSTSPLNATLVSLHFVTLSGLQASTTYHYRVKSKDAAANLTTSSDSTFTTIASGVQGTIRDDFNSSPLDTAWVWTDPRGDGSASLTTNPGHLQLNAPAGTAHDCWSGVTDCPRVLRSATNVDAVYETKLDGGALNTPYQAYGILLWQNSSNYLRVEYFRGSSGVQVNASRVVQGSGAQVLNGPSVILGASAYLRVTRTGTSYVVEYSSNGTNWSPAGTFSQSAFTVNQAGLYLLNSSGTSSPATTANFDYFMVRPAAATSSAVIEWQPGDQPPQAYAPGGWPPVKFQVATNNDGSTWNYVGPNGTSGTYYTVSGTPLSVVHNGDRYLRYRVYQTTADTSYTPNVSDVTITFASSCVPPGQAFFTKLTSATYTLEVSLSGYETYSSTVDLSPSWSSQDIRLVRE